MSGGHFDYQQSRLHDIADEIEELINTNSKSDRYGVVNDFAPATLARFREAVALLRRVYVYVQRIDWLVSCDDSEGVFHRRLREELETLEKEEKA